MQLPRLDSDRRKVHPPLVFNPSVLNLNRESVHSPSKSRTAEPTKPNPRLWTSTNTDPSWPGPKLSMGSWPSSTRPQLPQVGTPIVAQTTNPSMIEPRPEICNSLSNRMPLLPSVWPVVKPYRSLRAPSRRLGTSLGRLREERTASRAGRSVGSCLTSYCVFQRRCVVDGRCHWV